MKLHDYQKRAIEFAVQQKSAYMALDVGMGKTAIALKYLEHLVVKHPTVSALVLGPLRVIYNTWPDEIALWTPSLRYTILHDKHKESRIRKRAHIYLMNYDGLKWLYNYLLKGNNLKMWGKKMLVLDESTAVKNPSTKRFGMLQTMEPIFHPYRLCLSAYPSPNGLHELWSQFWILDKGKALGKTYYKYRSEHFHYTPPPVNRTVLREGHEPWIRASIAPRTYRLDAKDYLDLPPIKYNRIPISLPDSIRVEYDKIERDFFYSTGTKRITIFNAAAMSMKLRQYIQGALYDENYHYHIVHRMKLDILKEFIEYQQGNPLLVPIQFRFEIERIQKEFDNPPFIVGKVPHQTVGKYLRQWNAKQLPLLVCHPAAMAHGLNMQKGGHTILWLGLTWSLEQFHQLNGRLARQGQTKQVVVNIPVFTNTVEEVVYKAIVSKQRGQQALLDALREYQDAKEKG